MPASSPHSSSSTSPPRTWYPRWNETNEDREYCEVPPEHFLAQQGKAASRLYPSAAAGDDVSSPEYAYAYMAEQEATAGPSSGSTSSQGSQLQQPSLESASSPESQPQLPLSHLAQFFEATSAGSQMQASSRELPSDMPDTSTLAGADFDIDVRTGFLPPEPPLERLDDQLAESQWEDALTQARVVGLKINGGGMAVDDAERRRCRQWRRAVRSMPVVMPSRKMQTDIRYARRGHVVLTFLAHFYIHSQPQVSATMLDKSSTQRGNWLSSMWPSQKASAEVAEDAQDARDEASGKYAARLPASISAPLLMLSSQLDLPPVLTYADTVLWNWRFRDPSLGYQASNLEIVETFSGTPSEHHFFLTSLLIELRGVAALDLMRVCLDECFVGDALAKRRVAVYLSRLANVVKDLEKILHDVRDACDPATFYWAIRPWFRGGDASPFESKGWYYPASLPDEASPNLQPRLFTGPSAGQSSLIHALDVFFDVDHAGTKERVNGRPINQARVVAMNGQVTADATTLPEDATFMQRMQLYMPGMHRRFLTHLQSLTAEVEDELMDRDGGLPSNAMDVDGKSGETGKDSDSVAPAPPSPLRHLALSVSPGHSLAQAYDAALLSLRSLRDEHMRVATLYIVSQSRSKPPPQFAALNEDFVGHNATLVDREKRNADEEKSAALAQRQQQTGEETEESDAKGTGGTNLVQFLKACRANTVEALLKDSSPSRG